MTTVIDESKRVGYKKINNNIKIIIATYIIGRADNYDTMDPMIAIILLDIHKYLFRKCLGYNDNGKYTLYPLQGNLTTNNMYANRSVGFDYNTNTMYVEGSRWENDTKDTDQTFIIGIS